MSEGGSSILVARDRLRRILVQDRSLVAQECLDSLCQALIATAREQVVLMESDVTTAVEYKDGSVILTLRLPIVRAVDIEETTVIG